MAASNKLATSRSILHYDPERIDYAVTELELRQLEEVSNTIWKDVCLMSGSAFLAFGPNALIEIMGQDNFHFTAGLFFNSLLAIVSFCFFLIFGLAWKRMSGGRRKIVEEIRTKPKVILKADNLELEVVDSV